MCISPFSYFGNQWKVFKVENKVKPKSWPTSPQNDCVPKISIRLTSQMTHTKINSTFYTYPSFRINHYFWHLKSDFWICCAFRKRHKGIKMHTPNYRNFARSILFTLQVQSVYYRVRALLHKNFRTPLQNLSFYIKTKQNKKRLCLAG